MNKKTRTLVFIMVMFLLGSSSATAYQLMLKEVTVIDDEKVATYKTPASTVEEFLEKQGITLDIEDEINVEIDDPIEEGMTIEIIRSVPVKMELDGEEKIVYTKAKTVEDFLKEQNIALGEKGSINVSLDKEIVPEMELEIKTYKVEVVTHKEYIPFETEIKETLNLEPGEKQITIAGERGVKVVTTKIEYIGGVAQNTEIISSEVIKEPRNELIKIGAENVVEDANGKKYKYKEVLTMSATAYTASFKDTGKTPDHPAFGITYTGTRAKVGTVAVDPNVIPLGTKLFVEGYGYAVAEDIGGAIKGNKIDLYFDTQEEADNFGRQTRKVYILEDQ
ncbi:3D domain-containing protein [Defluviitalea phaphyphila]|uniref:3D domain-containing protein n=1 Tax=Defluviitalea phaphyphila TaxID=1473580 RepID=UPI000731C7E2|nr:3D domain-containing protein [Defluviitalea phaphyphila]